MTQHPTAAVRHSGAHPDRPEAQCLADDIRPGAGPSFRPTPSAAARDRPTAAAASARRPRARPGRSVPVPPAPQPAPPKPTRPAHRQGSHRRPEGSRPLRTGRSSRRSRRSHQSAPSQGRPKRGREQDESQRHPNSSAARLLRSAVVDRQLLSDGDLACWAVVTVTRTSNTRAPQASTKRVARYSENTPSSTWRRTSANPARSRAARISGGGTHAAVVSQ